MKILGAIIGDMVGSTRERFNVKTEDFELLPKKSCFTDDTVMTLAVAEWLMSDSSHAEHTLIECMQRLGQKYPYAGYGGMFRRWLRTENPEPYNSFGNGSAMRVSPVGLYANSLEEALELARVTASVSHNHPEGIKGAQAIAAAVFFAKTGRSECIKQYIEEEFGYDLSIDLEEIRDEYSFDVTCQGSVPIAIMSYLKYGDYPAERALRMAISMGGDSDTIGAMTASIAQVNGFTVELEEQCRALLPPDLLEINDRFIDFLNKPLYQSYKVYGDGFFFAGEYPGDENDEVAKCRIERMYHFGIRHFIDLTEEGEHKSYCDLLPQGATYTRFPIRDCGAPESMEDVKSLLLRIEEYTKLEECVYIHCWGGVGRTGTMVACYLAHNSNQPEFKQVLALLRRNFSDMPKSAIRETPETQEQIDFIARFIAASCSNKPNAKVKE